MTVISKKQLHTLVFCIMIWASQILLNLQLWKMNDRVVDVIPDRAYKLDPLLFETFTVGNLQATIDWLWINCLMDSSTQRVQPQVHPQLYYDLDVLTDLDPAYSEVYWAGANLLAVVRGDALGARDLLLKGEHFLKHELQQYPLEFRERFWGRSWGFPVLLAYVYLFELNDMPHASEAFREAAGFPGAPEYLLRLSSRLQRPGGEYEVGLKLINFMLLSAGDSRVRSELEKRRLNLFIGQYLFELNHAFQIYLSGQPGYRHLKSLNQKQMETYWKGFVRSNQVGRHDPWGGTVYLDSSGKVASTTPHRAVFGLE